ncbi:MAG: putative signal transducing protein [Sphingobacterium sp.]
MPEGWTKLNTHEDELSALLEKQLLEENGIVGVLINKQDSSFKFGKVELYVQHEQLQAAREVLGGADIDSVDED